MSDLVVKAQAREEFGKNASRRLRSEGRIPVVVYGRDLESFGVAVDPSEIVEILHSASGRNTIFSLEAGSNKTRVLIKDYQLDPIRGNLLHVDLQSISMDQTMLFQVPVEFSGTAVGVTDGGIMDITLRQIEVECLPGDVPDQLVVDVSEYEIGDTVRVSDLDITEGRFKLVTAQDHVVASIVAPRVEAEPELAIEEEEAAEPELIVKGKAEEGEEGGSEASEE